MPRDGEGIFQIARHGLRLAEDGVGERVEMTVSKAGEPCFCDGRSRCILTDENACLPGKKRLDGKKKEVQVRHVGKHNVRLLGADKPDEFEPRMPDAFEPKTVESDPWWRIGCAETIAGNEAQMNFETIWIEVAR